MLDGKFTSEHCYMPQMKTVLIEGCSFVNGFNTRYTRMRSSWAELFGLMKQHLSYMVQWIAIVVCIGLQKTHTFMWTRQSIYQDWCGLSCRDFIGPFFFEGTVTGPMYLNMLWASILPAIHHHYGNLPVYFQQDGVPPHYHQNVRSYLDETLPGQWVGQRGSVEYPPHSPDLPPLDFICVCVWGGGVPWRMWYIVENHQHRKCYGKKLKRHVPLS
jgi:hypothetical protein